VVNFLPRGFHFFLMVPDKGVHLGVLWQAICFAVNGLEWNPDQIGQDLLICEKL